MLAPVPVTINDVLPVAVKLTLPLAFGILTLLLPLLTPDEFIATQLKFPSPSVLNT